jgi:cell division protein FtsQ
VSLLVTLCLKIEYFNVSEVLIKDNFIIGTEEILNLAKVETGKNIFYMNLKMVETNVEGNPYILKAKVKRVLPNKISISVEEREAVFYGQSDGRFFIIDNKGFVLEIRDNMDNMNLISLQGFDYNNSEIGKLLPVDDNRKLNLISEISDLLSINSSDIKITSVDLTSTLDLKVYAGNVCIKLGGIISLKDKLNLAVNTIVSGNLKNETGYVDVSFEGNPVVFIEKQEEEQ